MPKKPIIDMRVLIYNWAEIASDGISAESKNFVRVQVLREGETEWVSIPMINVPGQPPMVENNDGQAAPSRTN